VDSDDWPGLLLLAAALVLLALVTAAEVAVASSHRVRPRPPAEKGPFRSSASGGLAGYLRESREVFTTLALARSLALVGSTAIVVYLVLREAGLNWSTLAVTFAVTLAGLALIQTVPRIVVSANPQRWATRLWPFVAVVRFALRPAALLLDLPAGLLLRGSRSLNWASLAGDEERSGTMDAEEREMIRGHGARRDHHPRNYGSPHRHRCRGQRRSFDEVSSSSSRLQPSRLRSAMTTSAWSRRQAT
jgi:CBS domain containing-hemolysin-like protein